MGIATQRVRQQTVAAIFPAGRGVGKIAVTGTAHAVQWAVAEQAVEVFRVCTFMTGKVFAVPVGEVCMIVMLHLVALPCGQNIKNGSVPGNGGIGAVSYMLMIPPDRNASLPTVTAEAGQF